ncbi:MAG TPA: aldo/keto reductase, partial [Candidatus Sulfotelmatobacter sp.]|nr:aldo/keto reductase [Candidatus Sulfotelmatobacter sp.]
MKTVSLGNNGPSVSQVGLGCMAMSDMYGPSDETESIATIHAALDAGINMLDTGDFYGMGHNEMLIRRAIEGRRKDVFLAVKFGAMRGPDGQFTGYDVRPEAIKNFLAYSLRRLGTDYIDLYQPSRVDARTPIEDVYGALAGLVQAGYIRHIGISEASAASIRRAAKAAAIVSLQIEYSLVSRGAEA